LNKLKDELKDKVMKDAEDSLDDSKKRKVKNDIRAENDVKLRQKKRILTLEMKDELSNYRKQSDDNYKDEVEVFSHSKKSRTSIMKKWSRQKQHKKSKFPVRKPKNLIY